MIQQLVECNTICQKSVNKLQRKAFLSGHVMFKTSNCNDDPNQSDACFSMLSQFQVALISDLSKINLTIQIPSVVSPTPTNPTLPSPYLSLIGWSAERLHVIGRRRRRLVFSLRCVCLGQALTRLFRLLSVSTIEY